MDGKNKLYGYGIRLLTVRDRSEGELVKKFKLQGYSDSEIEGVVSTLKDQGLLDDYRFADNWVNSRVQHKLFGTIRLRKELFEKHVAKSIINEVLSNLDEQVLINNLIKLLYKKYPVFNKNDKKLLFKAYSLVQRYGYSKDEFYKAVKIMEGRIGLN